MANEYISKEYVINKCKEHRELYISAWGDFSAMPKEDKATCDAYATCWSDVVNAPVADVQPVTRGRWITKAEEYYKAWQDSGRSWDDMPYFVTGLKFACSNCFEQFDNYVEGVEKWNGCPICFAKMEGAENEKT